MGVLNFEDYLKKRAAETGGVVTDAGPALISSALVFVINTLAGRKLLHTWIIPVNGKTTSGTNWSNTGGPTEDLSQVFLKSVCVFLKSFCDFKVVLRL